MSMITDFQEVAGFLLLWAYDLVFETVYAIFRCRPRKQIVGENILITGSGQGLGKLIAGRLARDNNTLHCVDINKALNEESAAELRKLGECEVFTYTCDVGSKEGVRELGRQIKENVPHRHVSYLFNIAGIVSGKLFSDETEEQMERVIRVNLMGTMYLQKLVFNEMLENEGHIINVSSLGGITPGSRMSSYAASKFAVRGFTQAVQGELALLNIKNVKLTCVLPHVTKTGLFNNVQAKWPLIFPLLEPEWVADQIIVATQEERDQVILPKISLVFMLPEHLMSLGVWRSYCDLMGSHLMNTFVKIRPE